MKQAKPWTIALLTTLGASRAAAGEPDAAVGRDDSPHSHFPPIPGTLAKELRPDRTDAGESPIAPDAAPATREEGPGLSAAPPRADDWIIGGSAEIQNRYVSEGVDEAPDAGAFFFGEVTFEKADFTLGAWYAQATRGSGVNEVNAFLQHDFEVMGVERRLLRNRYPGFLKQNIPVSPGSSPCATSPPDPESPPDRPSPATTQNPTRLRDSGDPRDWKTLRRLPYRDASGFVNSRAF